jgi:hypothetical protein
MSSSPVIIKSSTRLSLRPKTLPFSTLEAFLISSSSEEEKPKSSEPKKVDLKIIPKPVVLAEKLVSETSETDLDESTKTQAESDVYQGLHALGDPSRIANYLNQFTSTQASGSASSARSKPAYKPRKTFKKRGGFKKSFRKRKSMRYF